MDEREATLPTRIACLPGVADHVKAGPPSAPDKRVPWIEQWEGHSVRVRTALKMLAVMAEWTTTNALRGVPRNPRSHDLLNVAYWAWKQSTTPEAQRLRPHWFVDLSQGVQTRPWGENMPALCTNSHMYSLETDNTLDTNDLCKVVGTTPPTRDLLSECQTLDLLGESVSGPVIMSILLAALYDPVGPWWASSSTSTPIANAQPPEPPPDDGAAYEIGRLGFGRER